MTKRIVFNILKKEEEEIIEKVDILENYPEYFIYSDDVEKFSNKIKINNQLLQCNINQLNIKNNDLYFDGVYGNNVQYRSDRSAIDIELLLEVEEKNIETIDEQLRYLYCYECPRKFTAFFNFESNLNHYTLCTNTDLHFVSYVFYGIITKMEVLIVPCFIDEHFIRDFQQGTKEIFQDVITKKKYDITLEIKLLSGDGVLNYMPIKDRQMESIQKRKGRINMNIKTIDKK